MAKPCVLAPEAASRLLRRRVKTLRKTVDAVRAEDVEGIHDMRVASRRLRATLAEHRAVVDKAPLDAFRKQVRNITRLLGTARELDVCLEVLEDQRPRFHGPPRYALLYVVRRLRAKRQAEADAVARCADAVCAPEFDRNLMALFESLKPQGPCYIKVAMRNLKDRYQSLYRLYGLWESVPSDEVLHRIRVCFKKLRYTCESYRPLYGEPMAAFLPELKAAQETLGIWNDYRVLRDYIVDLQDDAPPKAKEGTPAFLAATDAEVARYLEAFPESTRAFFSHQRARQILALFEKPQMPCCRSKVPDLEALDKAY